MARPRTRARRRACAEKIKPKTKTRITKVSARTKAINELLIKNPETLSSDNLLKLADHLRVTSGKAGKTRKFKGNEPRRRAAFRVSETRSIESDGASTSSADENHNHIDMMPEKDNEKRQLRTTRSNPEPIGKLLKTSFLRRNMKKIRWDESENLIQSELKVRSSIANDPELCGFYTRTFNKKITYGQMRTMGWITEMVLFTGDPDENKTRGTENIKFDLKLLNFIKKEIYVPPKSRVQIIADRSDDWRSDVPVFTDLPGETPQNALSPDSLCIRYSNQNVFDKRKYPSMARATTTVLKCDCCSGGAITKCYENPNCPCYKRNMRLRSLQKVKDKKAHKLTQFSTFEPILVRNNDSYFDTLGFACSEECGCKGRCDNNVTLLLEKDIFQLEVFRKNKIIGFGIRTNTAIPSGTPVMEFAGELVGRNSSNSYNYTAFHKKEYQNIPTAFEKSEKQIMRETMEAFTERVEWVINPEEIGNVGRFVCHSCEPNLAMIRVFQKGFTPAHCRFILVTQEVVFPGSELTFDYGLNYVSTNLDNNCLCGKPSCTSSELYKMMRHASGTALEKYQALRYHVSFFNFEKNVLEKIEERDNAPGSSANH